MATSAGNGRFAALQAAERGLLAGWRHTPGKPPLAFTGFAFSAESPADTTLPNACLWVPALLLAERGTQVTLTLSCAAGEMESALARWQAAWDALPAGRTIRLPHRYDIHLNPLAQQAFLACGHAALAAISSGQLDKIVLTRTLGLVADVAIPAGPLLAVLAKQHPACAIFGVGHAENFFLGASPETLLLLAEEHVAVDALAGTAWRDAARPLDDDKNRREHDFVTQAVSQALGELCGDVAVPGFPEIMQLMRLSHLRRRITARRLPGISAFDLIARLHPTPAVGGTPTAAALAWLARHGERRGAWYAGGIGWIDAADNCDIAVALRCGQFMGRCATLYAGAGFVAGSDPLQEWFETEAKLSVLREALAALERSREKAA